MAVTAGAIGQTAFGKSVEQFKGAFFDPERVLKQMDRATYKALGKFGSFVRRTSRTSIKYSANPSDPGRPARGHKTGERFKVSKKTGIGKVQSVSPLREFILFGLDKDEKTVVIGPAKTNQKNAFGDKPIPEILEHGGAIQLHEHLHRFRDGTEKWIRTDLRYRLSGTSIRSAVGKPRRVRTVRIDRRPTMDLALEKELPKLEGMFKDSF